MTKSFLDLALKPYATAIFALVYLGFPSLPLSAEETIRLMPMTEVVQLMPSLDCPTDTKGEGLETENDDGTDSSDCDGCPNVYLFTVNGINAAIDHPLHWWVIERFPNIFGYVRYDPYETEPGGSHEGMVEWCDYEPWAVAEQIKGMIAEIKQNDPCAKVVVVGHSAGAIATYASEGSDCKVLIDPPLAAYPFGGWFCAFQHQLDQLGRSNIRKHPNYVPTTPHDPWQEPGEESCKSLEKISEAIDSCINSVLPEECQTTDEPLLSPCALLNQASDDTTETELFFSTQE